MALGSALVDRARLLRVSPTAEKVEGSTRFSEVKGPWFRARLMLNASPEQNTPSEARPRAVARPQLLMGKVDGDGEPLDLNAADHVEVDSKQLGRAVWEVAGDPQPLRKRRSVIGFQADLMRVQDHGAEPLPGRDDHLYTHPRGATASGPRPKVTS